jgi:predicted Rossmann fold flavoprotein
MKTYDGIIIGAGPAGVFTAINASSMAPAKRWAVVESAVEPLRKVRISGGGRCNVSNACWDLKELASRYPRGGRELFGPFHRFGPAEFLDWLDGEGVATKEEDHGRMFPVTDDSGTIVTALLNALGTHKVPLLRSQPIHEIAPVEDGFLLKTSQENMQTKRIVLATGSSKAGWELARSLGLQVVDPVPSLFTLGIPDRPLHECKGVSMPESVLELRTAGGIEHRTEGALLITHWGLSGPATLWCSALAARDLAACGYAGSMVVTWERTWPVERMECWIDERRQSAGRRKISGDRPTHLPLRLWQWACAKADIPGDQTWAGLRREQRQALAVHGAAPTLPVKGKAVHKEEFVTSGGIALDQVDFRSMEMRKCPGVHAVGEVLDIDAMTGGYNFQAAWTTGWHAGRALAEG